MKGWILAVVLVLALVGICTIALVLYLVVVLRRFNRKNPHARDARQLRTRVDAQLDGKMVEAAVATYRDLRALVAAHSTEPELVRYQMEAAATLARTAGDRRNVELATELYCDARDVTHVKVMPVLGELLRSFLPQDPGKALVCVELLARLAERFPDELLIYWTAKSRFERG